MLWSAAGRCDEQHHHDLAENEVGSVHFMTSCAKDVGADFNRAVTLLHSFQYEDARLAFEGIGRKDPDLRHGAMGRRDVALPRAVG
jgi:hypothetical protein